MKSTQNINISTNYYYRYCLKEKGLFFIKKFKRSKLFIQKYSNFRNRMFTPLLLIQNKLYFQQKSIFHIFILFE